MGCTHIHNTKFKQCPKCRAADAKKKSRKTREWRRLNQEKFINNNPWSRTYHSAKARAKKLNIPFTISKQDIKNLFTSNDGYCSVLKVQITKENPLSIDRIIPELGYVKSNIRLISFRANMLKSNATIEELTLIIEDLKGLLLR